MPEVSLVRSVVDVVLAECEGRSVERVSEVHLTIGMMSDVVEQYIPDLFRYLARGTVADGAEVVIRRTPVMMRCHGCYDIFPLDLHDESTWRCPRCGGHDYEVFSGNEFRIDRIVLREAPGVGGPAPASAAGEATAAA